MNILVVEDEGTTLENLRGEIADSVLGAEVFVAKTQADAIQQAKSLQTTDAMLDVAVVDLRIPAAHLNQTAKVTSLCHDIEELFPRVRIIHVTSYEGKEDINEHLRTYHWGVHASQASFISKLVPPGGTPWQTQVVQLILKYRILRPLLEVFRPDSGGTRGATHRIAALASDIADHWDVLDSETQAEILKYFAVEKVAGPDGQGQVLVGMRGDGDAG